MGVLLAIIVTACRVACAVAAILYLAAVPARRCKCARCRGQR